MLGQDTTHIIGYCRTRVKEWFRVREWVRVRGWVKVSGWVRQWVRVTSNKMLTYQENLKNGSYSVTELQKISYYSEPRAFRPIF